MLSLVCFLHRLKQWTSYSDSITGILAADNTGLVDRVKAQSTLKYPVPNKMFQPDWDVVEGNLVVAGVLVVARTRVVAGTDVVVAEAISTVAACTEAACATVARSCSRK